MKFKLLILLIVLMSALLVSAAVPVNVTWGAAPSSGGAIASVPFPGFTDEPTQPGPATTTIVAGLANIDKKLVEGVFSEKK